VLVRLIGSLEKQGPGGMPRSLSPKIAQVPENARRVRTRRTASQSWRTRRDPAYQSALMQGISLTTLNSRRRSLRSSLDVGVDQPLRSLWMFSMKIWAP
jgi:hypothetical protein